MPIINDTTLRDGEQAPFVAFNTHEKLRIATLLYEAGADELEIGIAAMGTKEQEDIKELLGLKLPLRMMSWNRATMHDLDASLACGVQAVDLSIPVSSKLIELKYGGNKERLLKTLHDVISHAKKEGLFVCIGAEDASRAEFSFLQEVLELGASLGANRFRYCDTVGILTPYQTFQNIQALVQLELLPIEMHMHNDFGMATANSIAGIEAGAISTNTTVIGLGERAGNASFEQVLMSLAHQFCQPRNIDASKLQTLTRFVSHAANRPIGVGAPIVGESIFCHESGIHASAMLRDGSAYEAFAPQEVGLVRAYPIGKHSGSAALHYHLKSLGLNPSKEQLKELLPKVREMVTKRKQVLSKDELKALYLCS